ncbi:CoA transferase [Actinoallomurus purpureus]|uniref:CaiB/BaiF CoA-transferase family protein n=1 Tax=Actinoallomurus purpureus TaxID=478114 RepID=UPI002093B216|nr:CoA transferase [Actinoallomurus purpureus]MCO6005228.1 CoA transferase [Actinoallomurus purpureus]
MIRVLEVGDYAAPDAGRMLVGLGADVAVVEPPGGVAARRGDPIGFAHRAAGKSSVSPEDALSLAPRCDVILDGTGEGPLAGVAADLVTAAGPGVVHVVLTPYGDGGPAADWAATDLTVGAAGGMLALIGRPDRPPLRPYGEQADQLAGLNAAIAALIATRAGGGQRVVVSGQAAVAASIEFGAITYIHTGRVPERTGSTHPLAPHTLFATADGLIAGGLGGSPRMWDAMLAWLTETGTAGDLADERWQDPVYRVEHREEIFDLLARVVGDLKRDQLFHEGQARRLPWAAVLRPEELTGNAQLVDRGFFVDVATPSGTARDAGFAARVQGSAPPDRLRVPEPGERPTWPSTGGRPRAAAPAGPRRGVLEGIRVLDLTWVLAGPYATKTLADHGAEVIKIESRHRPDPTRFSPGFHLSRSAETDPDTSGYFNNVNRNKKSVTVNLRTEEGRALALRLAAQCDVVVENFAAGVLDRLGLGYDRLREVREDIVVVSMSGMGHTGPWRDYVSYADAVSALSGWTALTGEPGEQPVGVVYGLADIIAGHHAALATLAALAVRDRTGAGQHVDLAQLETAAAHLGDAILRADLGETVEPLGDRHPRMAPHGVFPCLGDGTWVALAVRSDEEFARLAEVAGLAGDARWATLAGRKADETAIEERVAAWTRSRPAESVAEVLQREGIPAYPVRDGRTLVEHDGALRAWDFYTPLTHPSAGTFLHEGLPARLTRTPGGVHTPAPRLGEHTAELLTGLLGLGEAEQAALRTAGVLE